jgi:hypothetical protein
MDTLQGLLCSMKGFAWERLTLDVSLSTSNARLMGGIVEIDSCNSTVETFNAYMSH